MKAKLAWVPAAAAEDLKWLLWNQLWRAANSAKADRCQADERASRRRAAEEDAKRSEGHLRALEASGLLSEGTLSALRGLAEDWGRTAAAAATMESPAQALAAQARAAEAPAGPGDLESELWLALLKVVQLAAAAVAELLEDRGATGQATLAVYDRSWQRLADPAVPPMRVRAELGAHFKWMSRGPQATPGRRPEEAGPPADVAGLWTVTQTGSEDPPWPCVLEQEPGSDTFSIRGMEIRRAQIRGSSISFRFGEASCVGHLEGDGLRMSLEMKRRDGHETYSFVRETEVAPEPAAQPWSDVPDDSVVFRECGIYYSMNVGLTMMAGRFHYGVGFPHGDDVLIIDFRPDGGVHWKDGPLHARWQKKITKSLAASVGIRRLREVAHELVRPFDPGVFDCQTFADQFFHKVDASLEANGSRVHPTT